MSKFLVLLLISFALSEMNIERQREIADRVNKLKTTWTAEAYPTMKSQVIATQVPSRKLRLKPKSSTKPMKLPDSYDLRQEYPNCESLQEINDHAECPAHWAFSTAGALSDRICIKSKGELQTRISPLYILSCCNYCG